MGFRVEKFDRSFLLHYKDHRKKLAARQHQEREEAAKRRAREQAEERNKRAASRAISLPPHKPTPPFHNPIPPIQESSTSGNPPLNPPLVFDQLSMAGINGEEISEHISPGSRRSRDTSASSEAIALAGIKFKKMNSGVGNRPTSSVSQLGARPTEANPTNPQQSQSNAEPSNPISAARGSKRVDKSKLIDLIEKDNCKQDTNNSPMVPSLSPRSYPCVIWW